MSVHRPATAATTTTTTSTTDNDDKLSQALKSVLQQAASQGRVTCSLTACVELLSTRPDDVMLCVMPLLPQADAAATIQSTLIRAVCQEHSIRVLSVDCDVKLAKAVCLSAEEEEEEKKKQVAEAVDDNCNTLLKTPATCSDDAPLLISGCDNLAPVMGFPCVLVQVSLNSRLLLLEISMSRVIKKRSMIVVSNESSRVF